MNSPLRVAVLGAGTVGREVVRAFLETPERLEGSARPLVLTGVATRDVDRAAASGIPRHLLTDDASRLAAADTTDLVCELLGGDEPARAVISAALAFGKPVVTANKQVVARHGPALEAEAGATGTPLRFEAAVGGGIPVLATIAGDLAANRVLRLRAIVNGTTNVVLTAMARDGRTYEESLAAAQSAGYAESDPGADVEGFDAASKLAILARVAVGAWLDPDAIERHGATVDGTGAPGITGIRSLDVAGAAAVGRVIKLVADLVTEGDGSMRASVLPTAVPADDPLGRTNGRMNRIEVRAEPLGSVALVGPGAGGAATASAVLGDLLAIARGEGSSWTGRSAVEQLAMTPLGPVTQGPERGWFLVLPPNVPASRIGDRIGLPVECGPVDGGTALHVPGGSLEAVRAAVRAVASGSDLDPLPIYPADEHLQ